MTETWSLFLTGCRHVPHGLNEMPRKKVPGSLVEFRGDVYIFFFFSVLTVCLFFEVKTGRENTFDCRINCSIPLVLKIEL